MELLDGRGFAQEQLLRHGWDCIVNAARTEHINSLNPDPHIGINQPAEQQLIGIRASHVPQLLKPLNAHAWISISDLTFRVFDYILVLLTLLPVAGTLEALE